MFLGTSEELSGTFGLGRGRYGGTCDGHRGTLGTYTLGTYKYYGGTLKVWDDRALEDCVEWGCCRDVKLWVRKEF